MKITKKTVVAGTVGAVAASGLGLVLLGAPLASAATTDSSSTSSSATTNVSNRLQAIKDALAGLVGDGTLTQAQADTVAGTLNSSDALRGGGHGGHGGHLIDLDTAATTIGISTDDLRTALDADGATLASVAADHNVTQQKLVDALVAAAKTHLTEEVTEGDLTQAQADAKAATLSADITTAVGQQFTGGRGGHHDNDSDDSATSGGSTSGSSSSSTAA